MFRGDSCKPEVEIWPTTLSLEPSPIFLMPSTNNSFGSVTRKWILNKMSSDMDLDILIDPGCEGFTPLSSVY